MCVWCVCVCVCVHVVKLVLLRFAHLSTSSFLLTHFEQFLNVFVITKDGKDLKLFMSLEI